MSGPSFQALLEAGLDWETEQFPAQLRSWLAQERSTNQLVFCRHEADPRPTRATAVPLYRCGPSKYFSHVSNIFICSRYSACSAGEYRVRYQYQGKLDPESGRFKGQGSLTFLAQEEASRFSRRPGLDTVDRIGEEETCIIDNAFMSIDSITGTFKQGLPRGSVTVKHHNFATLKEGLHLILSKHILLAHCRATLLMGCSMGKLS